MRGWTASAAIAMAAMVGISAGCGESEQVADEPEADLAGEVNTPQPARAEMLNCSGAPGGLHLVRARVDNPNERAVLYGFGVSARAAEGHDYFAPALAVVLGPGEGGTQLVGGFPNNGNDLATGPGGCELTPWQADSWEAVAGALVPEGLAGDPQALEALVRADINARSCDEGAFAQCAHQVACELSGPLRGQCRVSLVGSGVDGEVAARELLVDAELADGRIESTLRASS